MEQSQSFDYAYIMLLQKAQQQIFFLVVMLGYENGYR
jgi:hypothetical protein